MTASPRDLPFSRLTLRGLAREVAIGLVQRPGRSVLTALGTVLGVGTLVAVLGLTATAQGQVSHRFTVLAATGVVVQQDSSAAAIATGGEPYNAFPADSEQLIRTINGVRSAGVWWTAVTGSRATVTAAVPGTGSRTPVDTAVYAADPGAIAASRPHWLQGWSYGDLDEKRSERVVVLGRTAARELGISRVDAQPAVFIGGMAFTVVGILEDVARNKEFLDSVLVPSRTATSTWGLPKEVAPQMTIETDLGAAAQVATQAPLALRPDHPEYFQAIAPPDPMSLADAVSGDLNSLFLVLAAISLIIGTFGIANTTLVAVLERVPEIGLRRAVGARPRHVAVQFLAESAALGTIGGFVGTAVGVATVLLVAITHSWTAIMPASLTGAPVLGMLTGLFAGLYPAWRATRVEPSAALRQ